MYASRSSDPISRELCSRCVTAWRPWAVEPSLDMNGWSKPGGKCSCPGRWISVNVLLFAKCTAKNYHITETLIIKNYIFWTMTVVHFRKRVTWSSDLTSCITQKTLLCCYGNSASATQRSSLRQQPQIRQVTSAFVCTEFVFIILQHKLNQPPRLLGLRGVCYWNARPKVCLREYLHKATIRESGLNLSVKSAKTFLFT